MIRKNTKTVAEEREDLPSNIRKDTKSETSEEICKMKSKSPKNRKSYVAEYERTKILREGESDRIDEDDDDWSDEDEDEDDSAKDKYLFTIDARKVAFFGLGVAVGYLAYKYVSKE